MDYPLELLGPERFQQLCQALLVKEFPKLQAFPIAQPDGGRDAISYYSSDNSGRFTVFQVKFVRRPEAIPDPHKWLLSVMEEELPKVARLVPRGAAQYFLLTNVPGTAHPHTGSIDLLADLFSKNLKIPGMCWWRDDINRRLDDAWSLKWVYPELLTGPDLLRSIIESGLTEHKERRSSTIRAFLRQQYEQDEQVRFKQVELQNDLLELFVDVPLSIREQQVNRQHLSNYYSVRHELVSRIHYAEDFETQQELSPESVARWHSVPDVPLGSATLLLSAAAQRNLSHVVVEGAPGQGKSTITQYICQVYRMRLLLEEEVLSKVVREHKEVPLRLPIRVDLRDLAAWLNRQNPFTNDPSEPLPASWGKSLESFLASLISHNAGDTVFTSDDLIAVAKLSNVLLVFDGLDEVADIGTRREVVDAISRGVARLEENAAGLQTIVTSRPAAFANSPGMSDTKYLTLQLLSLPKNLIDEYADKWLRARRMESRQSSEFKRILKSKLDQPHLRDLARNPMQLAILLSLILTRGSSLPDKRTSLYDNYIDLFLNRESEKSAIVREHRTLLIDIHQYIAWVIHVEVEEKKLTTARITADRLQTLLREYLDKHGYQTTLATALFTGVTERVVALVSRVEGTFEFEVQPLREYFVARFLYDTAPYSPPGREQRGTKPDRFDALARNFFWLNVVRFYAGCFSKGELASLVERMEVLIKDDVFGLTSHPKALAATLLSDWVFSQNPRSVREVAKLILEGRGLRFLTAAHSIRRPAQTSALVLPPNCGREEVIERCFDLLAKHPAYDYAREIAIVLRESNVSASNLADEWLRRLSLQDKSTREQWMSYGLILGVVSTIDKTRLLQALDGETDDEWKVRLLFRARRIDLLERDEASFTYALDSVLKGNLSSQPQRKVESAIDALAHAVDPWRYGLGLRERVPVPLTVLLEQRNRVVSLKWDPKIATATESYEGHHRAVALAQLSLSLCQKTAAEWSSELAPWDELVEEGRRSWGDQFAFDRLALLASGIRSPIDKGRGYEDLFAHSASLCQRARHARLKSGATTWWKYQLRVARTERDASLALMLILRWSKENVLMANIEALDEMLDRLPPSEWRNVIRAVRGLTYYLNLGSASRWAFRAEDLPQALSMRTALALSIRADEVLSSALYERYFKRRDLPTDQLLLEFVQQNALHLGSFNTTNWKPDLEVVEACYVRGVTEDFLPHSINHVSLPKSTSGLSLAFARKIGENATAYPGFLVNLAELRSREEAEKLIRPIGTVAREEGWFQSVV